MLQYSRIYRVVFMSLLLFVLACWAGGDTLVSAAGSLPAPAAAVFTNCAAIADVPEAECNALVNLYTRTNGAAWTDKTNWMVTNTVCNWVGITCSTSVIKKVEQINLYNNNLTGNLTDPFTIDFTGFTALWNFYLGNDPIAGDISAFLPMLPTTLQELYMNSTDITGVIPASISNFTALTALYLGDSNLTGQDFGTLLTNLPATLESLNLRTSNMTGTITSEISKMVNLDYLVLAYNQLGGDFGQILGYIPTGASYLWLGNNDFTGTVPPSVSGFSGLKILSLSWNQMSGDMGVVISNLPPSLTMLELDSNDFTGTIPASIASLTSLEYLYLRLNQLNGDLATILGNMPTSIKTIDIGNNNFTGTIPASISNLPALLSLSVSHMPGVSGTIPLSITSLPPFWSLNLAGTYLCEPDDPAYDAWKASVNYYYSSLCLRAFNGGAVITSPQPIVAIGRPHMGIEIMAYSGVNAGAATVYLPMLFYNTWGNYTSSFTVENVGGGTATFDFSFADALTGDTTCVIENETLEVNGIRTYDISMLPACTAGSMDSGWYGGATITSDVDVTAVARPMINGTDAVTYNGFTSGADTVFLPMLFRGIWGYQSAFYVQNLDASLDANVSIDFYDSQGNFTCTYTDPSPISPSVTRGYWMANINKTTLDCTGGTGFAPGGWAGNAIVNTGAGSGTIVAIGRPHLGTEVAAYSGVDKGSNTNYLPMLFRGQWGYDSAIYIQNLEGAASDVEIEFYDTDGNYTCTYSASGEIGAKATRGYWTPSLTCTSGSFPAKWAGSARITTSKEAAVVGRPHLSDGQVVVYNAFSGGGGTVFVPQLFNKYSGNESALYIQNLGGILTSATINFFDEESGFYCTMTKDIAPYASSAIWLASLDGAVCVP